MQKKVRGFWLVDVASALQANVGRAGSAAGASYTLVGAILLLGGAGYVLDEWLGMAPWLLFTGLALGMVVGFYELVRITRPR
jgi:F0F1-type ATP synthase assembly protein I